MLKANIVWEDIVGNANFIQQAQFKHIYVYKCVLIKFDKIVVQGFLRLNYNWTLPQVHSCFSVFDLYFVYLFFTGKTQCLLRICLIKYWLWKCSKIHTEHRQYFIMLSETDWERIGLHWTFRKAKHVKLSICRILPFKSKQWKQTWSNEVTLCSWVSKKPQYLLPLPVANLPPPPLCTTGSPSNQDLTIVVKKPYTQGQSCILLEWVQLYIQEYTNNYCWFIHQRPLKSSCCPWVCRWLKRHRRFGDSWDKGKGVCLLA